MLISMVSELKKLRILIIGGIICNYVNQIGRFYGVRSCVSRNIENASDYVNLSRPVAGGRDLILL